MVGNVSQATAAKLMRAVAKLLTSTRSCTHVVHYLAAQRAEPDGLHILTELFPASLAEELPPQPSAGQPPSAPP